MPRIIVQSPVPVGSIGQPNNGQIIGEGLDTIDPTLPLTPVVKAAFLTCAELVRVIGDGNQGDFRRVADWTEVKAAHGRLTVMRYTVYEFQGWIPF